MGKNHTLGLGFGILEKSSIQLVFSENAFGLIIELGRPMGLENMAKTIMGVLEDVPSGGNVGMKDKFKVDFRSKKGYVFLNLGGENVRNSILQWNSLMVMFN